MKVSREMGITHQELFRLLPAAVEHRQYTVAGDRITIAAEDACMGTHALVCMHWYACIEICYSAEGERQIASMRFPVTSLQFGFRGWDEQQVGSFMRRFDRVFHKGGG